jgi:RNA polymerase sigma-70 factor (ECF subfamily)
MPGNSNLDDVLDAVLRGNTDAFLEIERVYAPTLRAFLASQMFYLDDVDDLAQETLIVAYRKLNTFRRSEDFGAWLRGIARNKLLQYFEQTGRRSALMEGFRREAAALISNELEEAASRTRSEHLQTMLSCIAKLPERMRQVVRTALDGNKPSALVTEFEMTAGAIYQLQYRALKLLRECIVREASHGR